MTILTRRELIADLAVSLEDALKDVPEEQRDEARAAMLESLASFFRGLSMRSEKERSE